MSTLGRVVQANVKRLRLAQGMTHDGLAAALAKAGRPIHPTGISRLERGRRRLDVDDLGALAAALGVPASALLGETCPTCGDNPPRGFACTTCGRGAA